MALKRKEPSSHEKIGRKVKCVLLNEISQTEKSTMYTVKHQWLPGVWGQGVGMVVEDEQVEHRGHLASENSTIP